MSRLSQKFKNVLILFSASFSISLMVFLFVELSQANDSSENSSDIGSIQKQLVEKKKDLEEKEKQLADKEQILSNKEKVLQDQVKNYERAMEKMKERVAELEEVKKNNLTALKNLYEKMESKKAANVLGDMSPVVSSRILASLKSDRAAEILGRMEVEKARKITERLASSHQ